MHLHSIHISFEIILRSEVSYFLERNNVIQMIIQQQIQWTTIIIKKYGVVFL